MYKKLRNKTCLNMHEMKKKTNYITSKKGLKTDANQTKLNECKKMQSLLDFELTSMHLR